MANSGKRDGSMEAARRNSKAKTARRKPGRMIDRQKGKQRRTDRKKVKSNSMEKETIIGEAAGH